MLPEIEQLDERLTFFTPRLNKLFNTEQSTNYHQQDNLNAIWSTIKELVLEHGDVLSFIAEENFKDFLKYLSAPISGNLYKMKRSIRNWFANVEYMLPEHKLKEASPSLIKKTYMVKTKGVQELV